MARGGVRVTDEASMISSSLRSIVLAGALMGAGIVGPAGTALARTSYDGNWSVLIVTHSGACERALRYPVQISNGNVLSEGGSANLQGRVAPSGAVRVSVSADSQWAPPIGARTSVNRSGQRPGPGADF